jgi:hypothetical protein
MSPRGQTPRQRRRIRWTRRPSAESRPRHEAAAAARIAATAARIVARVRRQAGIASSRA